MWKNFDNEYTLFAWHNRLTALLFPQWGTQKQYNRNVPVSFGSKMALAIYSL